MPPSPGYIPGPLVIPQCLEVRLKWTLPNDRLATNVLHAFLDTGATIPTGLADTLFAGISTSGAFTALAVYLSDATLFTSIDVKDLRVAGGTISESTGVAVAGTDTTNALPEEVALAVTLRTAFSGRAFRGRTYLAGFGTAAIDATGHAVTGLVTAAQGFMQDVSDQMFAAGTALVVAQRGHAAYTSPFTGNTVPAENAGVQFVTSISVRDNLFDSQRRRK
jgi:hypothetical protein